jgi:hypothetical protein
MVHEEAGGFAMSSLSSTDLEQVRLLAIFHYVVGGLAVFLSFLPLLYTVIGAFFVYAANHGKVQSGHEPPPEVLGWIFIGFGCAFFLVGLSVAVCILLAGRSLTKQKRYWFVFVVACLECLFIPFGTILGVLTLIVLSRESVKTQFSARPT